MRRALIRFLRMVSGGLRGAADGLLDPPRPRYRMEIAWSDEDDAYVVTVPDLPGCATHGATYVDAARMGEDAIAAWLDGARHRGKGAP